MPRSTITSCLSRRSFREARTQSLRGRISTVAVGAALAALAAVVIPGASSASASDVHFTGDGTTDSPFTSDGCTNWTSADEWGEGDCIVGFPTRYLSVLQNEKIPSYRCPAVAPYLRDQPSNRPGYAPKGVDVVASEGVDTWIDPAHAQTVGLSGAPPGVGIAVGIAPGSADTATYWLGAHREGTYFVALFCTSKEYRGYLGFR